MQTQHLPPSTTRPIAPAMIAPPHAYWCLHIEQLQWPGSNQSLEFNETLAGFSGAGVHPLRTLQFFKESFLIPHMFKALSYTFVHKVGDQAHHHSFTLLGKYSFTEVLQGCASVRMKHSCFPFSACTEILNSPVCKQHLAGFLSLSWWIITDLPQSWGVWAEGEEHSIQRVRVGSEQRAHAFILWSCLCYLRLHPIMDHCLPWSNLMT